MGVDSEMKNRSPCLILRLLSYKSGSPKLQLFINATAQKHGYSRLQILPVEYMYDSGSSRDYYLYQITCSHDSNLNSSDIFSRHYV